MYGSRTAAGVVGGCAAAAAFGGGAGFVRAHDGSNRGWWCVAEEPARDVAAREVSSGATRENAPIQRCIAVRFDDAGAGVMWQARTVVAMVRMFVHSGSNELAH